MCKDNYMTVLQQYITFLSHLFPLLKTALAKANGNFLGYFSVVVNNKCAYREVIFSFRGS